MRRLYVVYPLSSGYNFNYFAFFRLITNLILNETTLFAMALVKSIFHRKIVFLMLNATRISTHIYVYIYENAAL